MPTFNLHVDPDDTVVRPIAEGLRRYDESRIGRQERHALAVTASDERGECIAGVQGVAQWGWLYIERMWVSEEHRGSGLGSVLLDRIEAEARRRGVHRYVLLTTSWQTPGFYAARGYRRIATFELNLPGVVLEEAPFDYLLMKLE